MFGLMTVKAHEKAMREVKAAAARDIVTEQRRNEKLATEIAALKPDAEAMRRKRQRDVDQKAEKRKNAAKPVARFSKPIPEPKPAAKKGAR